MTNDESSPNVEARNGTLRRPAKSLPDRGCRLRISSTLRSVHPPRPSRAVLLRIACCRGGLPATEDGTFGFLSGFVIRHSSFGFRHSSFWFHCGVEFVRYCVTSGTINSMGCDLRVCERLACAGWMRTRTATGRLVAPVE